MHTNQAVTNLINLSNNTMLPKEIRKQALRTALEAMKVKVLEEFISPAEQS